MASTAKFAVVEPIPVIGEYPRVFRVGKLQNITLTKWLGEALDGSAAATLAQVTNQVIADAKGTRWSSIHFVEGAVKLPDSAGRQVLANLVRSSAETMGCVVVVIEADGFVASALRSLVTGLRVLAPRTFDVRVEAAAADVIAWFPDEHQRRTGVEVDPKDLERLLSLGRSWRAQAAADPVA